MLQCIDLLAGNYFTFIGHRHKYLVSIMSQLRFIVASITERLAAFGPGQAQIIHLRRHTLHCLNVDLSHTKVCAGKYDLHWNFYIYRKKSKMRR